MKRLVFLVLLLVGVLSSLLADGSYVPVKFGERPSINLDKVPASAYVKGTIQFKLNDSKLIAQIEENEKNSGIKEALEVAFPQILSLNTRFKIEEVSKIFDSPTLKNEYQDRHKQWGLNRWYKVEFSDRNDVIEIVKEFNSLAEVQIAEPVYKKQIIKSVKTEKIEISESTKSGKWTPDDTYFSAQWHYHNTGQDNGTVDADIDLPEAWELEKGNSDVIVAIVDEGIDYDHEDIAGNMWSSIGPNGSNTPAGDHGTHVAGTVAGETNNATGISGIAGGSGNNDGVRVMSINMLGDSPTVGDEAGVIYAADNGAVISQNSWGYTSVNVYNQSSLDGIDYFNANAGGSGAVLDGGLTIFAAGNDNATGNWYPGCYSGAMAVASTDRNDVKSSFSNYGDWIEISAPGSDIASLAPDNGYVYMSGTSMACPHVSGVAALAVSYAPGTMTALELRNLLKDNVDDISSLNSSYNGKIGTGRLNAYKVLSALGTTPGPTPPTCDITAPNSGTTYTIGTDITISVDATDAAKDSFNEFDKKNRKEIALRGSKSVTKVEFYANGSLLGSDSSAPYSFSFSTTGYSAGSLSLTAKTTDDEGLATSSDAISVTLESGTPPTYLYAYDFESGTDNWTIKNSTEGFQRGTGSSLSMGNGSGSNFLGANSDKAGNNGPHVTDYATSPSLNFAGYSNLTVKFDYMLRRYQEFDHLYVVYRTSSSSSWITIEDLAVTGDWDSWTNHTTALPTAAQANGVQLAFFYDDNSGWGYGAGFDNIEINGEASSNQPPTCEISSPSNNAEFTVGAAINITVNAQDLGKNSYGNKKNLSIKEINSKSVGSVEFYIDNVLKYTDSSLPYSYSWISAGVGTHAITAIAKDDMGLSTTSEKVNISLIEESNGSGETLPYTTNFNDTEGWTQSNDNCTARWSTSATNKAGGTSSEIKAHWEQKDPATTSFISPEFNTTGMTSLELSFKHFYDYYGAGVTVKVQSSSNGTDWTDESWVVNPTANMGAETKTVEITHNVGSTTQIAFVLSGNLYQFDDWYIDDVEVKEADGNTGGPVAVTALDEGFENGGSIPTGWSQSRTNGTTDWTFVNGGHNSKPSAANTGSYNALLYLGSTTANSTMLITPSMDLAGVSDATVEFYHAQALWSPDQDELKVYYRTTSSGSWNELAHYTSSVTDWTKRTITLPNVSGTYYLAFEGIAKYGYGASLDDVLVTGTLDRDKNCNNFIDSFTLNQNYPNPFNPITSISYSLNNASKVKIAVYNVKGEIVWNSGELRQNTGKHSFSFDGSRFNSGVFYYSLTVGSKTVTKKMILVK